jgi:hypothetical protein
MLPEAPRRGNPIRRPLVVIRLRQCDRTGEGRRPGPQRDAHTGVPATGSLHDGASLKTRRGYDPLLRACAVSSVRIRA